MIATLGLAFAVPVSAAARAERAIPAAAAARAAGGGLAAGRAPAALGGTWGRAREIPGTARLNAGGFAEVRSVSCASPGNCSAGGYYTDASLGQQAFVVTQKNGIWGTAEQVPGMAGLHAAEAVAVSLSCPTAGNCSVGGTYLDAGHDNRAWVVAQKNGIWGEAEDVPGTGPGAGTWSVSCGSPGNCSAGGDRSGHGEAFVVNEVNGVWGTAERVPGTASVKPAVVASVSCTAANRCSAGGSYYDSAGHFQVFVVTRR